MDFHPALAAALALIVVIGLVVGVVFDRVAGPGWFARQVVGSRRTIVTSALIGIAGAFIGFHLFNVLGILGFAPLVGAALGAAAVLWGWRTLR